MTREQSYSVVEVAVLLLATAELWLFGTEPPRQRLNAESTCPHCWGRGETRQKIGNTVWVRSCLRCAGRGVSSEQVADVLAGLVRNYRDPEAVMVAVADLGVAMSRVDDYTRRGIDSFVKYPPDIDPGVAGTSRTPGIPGRVLFHPYQRRHLMTVWRAINGMGEFSREARDGDARRSHRSNVPGLSAATS